MQSSQWSGGDFQLIIFTEFAGSKVRNSDGIVDTFSSAETSLSKW